MSEKIDDRLLFKIGSKIQICGSSGSGKTYWLSNYLLNIDNRFDEIIWVTNELSSQQDLITKLEDKLGDKFILMIGLKNNEQELKMMFKENHDEKKKTAVIIDDLMMEQGNFTTELFLAGRHLNITIFEIIQSIFTGNKQSRNMQNNVQYYILFNFPDIISVVNLAQRLSSNKNDRDLIVKAYKDATSKKGGCLIIDTITNQYDMENSKILRFRDTQLNNVYKNLKDI
jgi:hypothetical protein